MAYKKLSPISHLITNMAMEDAPEKDLARAIGYSRAVIDAKNRSDCEKAEREYDMKELRSRYHGGGFYWKRIRTKGKEN